MIREFAALTLIATTTVFRWEHQVWEQEWRGNDNISSTAKEEIMAKDAAYNFGSYVLTTIL